MGEGQAMGAFEGTGGKEHLEVDVEDQRPIEGMRFVFGDMAQGNVELKGKSKQVRRDSNGPEGMPVSPN